MKWSRESKGVEKVGMGGFVSWMWKGRVKRATEKESVLLQDTQGSHFAMETVSLCSLLFCDRVICCRFFRGNSKPASRRWISSGLRCVFVTSRAWTLHSAGSASPSSAPCDTLTTKGISVSPSTTPWSSCRTSGSVSCAASSVRKAAEGDRSGDECEELPVRNLGRACGKELAFPILGLVSLTGSAQKYAPGALDRQESRETASMSTRCTVDASSCPSAVTVALML
ncbi:hypothetical protein BDY17DRAFT_293651 [Neohortaea acidophila]|uniref:Uncharacterized protein n=1 Tax=Neohortaea acidophila TaxID=245834 RepID=A0A6A6PZA6_9PEZI|nr:uncharacterized protein BDY17DRAFT_293651 [Neohortaea acidophila]KAF2485460.1 hypothetical protein BDY17DRAFT_293651 [Neohortaea acidophila]